MTRVQWPSHAGQTTRGTRPTDRRGPGRRTARVKMVSLSVPSARRWRTSGPPRPMGGSTRKRSSKRPTYIVEPRFTSQFRALYRYLHFTWWDAYVGIGPVNATSNGTRLSFGKSKSAIHFSFAWDERSCRLPDHDGCCHHQTGQESTIWPPLPSCLYQVRGGTRSICWRSWTARGSTTSTGRQGCCTSCRQLLLGKAS